MNQKNKTIPRKQKHQKKQTHKSGNALMDNRYKVLNTPLNKLEELEQHKIEVLLG